MSAFRWRACHESPTCTAESHEWGVAVVRSRGDSRRDDAHDAAAARPVRGARVRGTPRSAARRASPRRAPVAEVERLLRLYRTEYAGWSVRHFYEYVQEREPLTLSYTCVKTALQGAGLVRTRRPRGRPFRRRERRPRCGELLHLDGRRHPRLARGRLPGGIEGRGSRIEDRGSPPAGGRDLPSFILDLPSSILGPSED